MELKLIESLGMDNTSYTKYTKEEFLKYYEELLERLDSYETLYKSTKDKLTSTLVDDKKNLDQRFNPGLTELFLIMCKISMCNL